MFAVLFGILGVINITNYHNINKRADRILSLLIENGGKFPKLDMPMENIDRMPPSISPEVPFETRYFTVFFDDNGNINASNTGSIAAISNKSAQDYAKEVYASGKESGFYDDYKYKLAKYNDETFIIFLDCGRDFDTFRTFLTVSIFVSFIGIILVFILVLVLSKIAMGPIAQSYEKQKQFITDASHEIRTPLTIIDANTEIAEMKSGENKWTQSTRQQVKRLSELTSNLIALAKMDEGDTKTLMTDFSLSNAVLEATEPFMSLAKVQGKSLKINVERDISYFGDEKALRQLLSILLDNAMKYSNDSADIKLTLKRNNKKRELTLFNTVDNITFGNHNEFFDRFYRGDTSRNNEMAGYGNGLSLAKSICDSHKGSISAKSDDGKSLTITVLL
ncbi:MAG: sensor histidine kinase [Anaerorhabdus sp.]